ncbi:MAG: peptidase, partial [Planctomycetales bacterium]|nr:peptidase [Planctomycetales bacterium]
EVAPPYIALQFPQSATSQGADCEYRIAVEQKTKFDGKARLELAGLPPGVSAEPQEFDQGASEIVVPLKVAADARPGKHWMVSRVIPTTAGEPVLHTIGGASLQIDVAEPVESTQE